MRHDPDLIARVISQMDSSDENVRLVAFAKARAMLTAAGTTFGEVYAASRRAGGPSADPTPRDVPVGPYLHKPLVGRFARSWNGRPVRRCWPPNGVPGRLRILRDETEFRDSLLDLRSIEMSFETADALYEPFRRTSSDQEWLAAVRISSATGEPLVFTPHVG